MDPSLTSPGWEKATTPVADMLAMPFTSARPAEYDNYLPNSNQLGLAYALLDPASGPPEPAPGARPAGPGRGR